MSSEEGLRWGPACSGGRMPRAKCHPHRKGRYTRPVCHLAQLGTLPRDTRLRASSAVVGRPAPHREEGWAQARAAPSGRAGGSRGRTGSREGLADGARGQRGHGPVTCPPAPGPPPRTTEASGRTAAGNRGRGGLQGGHRKEAGRQVRPPVQLPQVGSPVCRAWPGVASGDQCFLPHVPCAFL